MTDSLIDTYLIAVKSAIRRNSANAILYAYVRLREHLYWEYALPQDWENHSALRVLWARIARLEANIKDRPLAYRKELKEAITRYTQLRG